MTTTYIFQRKFNYESMLLRLLLESERHKTIYY